MTFIPVGRAYLLGSTLVLLACGGVPAIAARAQHTPELLQPRERTRARVQGLVRTLLARGSDRAAIREHWFGDVAVVSVVRPNHAFEGSIVEGWLVTPVGQIDLSSEHLTRLEPGDECLDGQCEVMVELRVGGDPEDGVAILSGGRAELAFTTAHGELEHVGGCEGDLRVEPSICGELLACRPSFRVPGGFSIAAVVDDGRIVRDHPCGRAITSFRDGVDSYFLSERSGAIDAARPMLAPCSMPSHDEIERARAAIVRELSARRSDQGRRTLDDLQRALGEPEATCRHPRNGGFALMFTDECGTYHSIWWIGPRSRREIVEYTYEDDEAVTPRLVLHAADVDADGTPDLIVDVPRLASATPEGGSDEPIDSCEAVVLSGSWPLERAPRIPCNATPIAAENGRVALLYEDNSIHAWRDGSMHEVDGGFDEVRRAIRQRETLDEVMSEVLGADAASCVDAGWESRLRAALEARGIAPEPARNYALLFSGSCELR